MDWQAIGVRLAPVLALVFGLSAVVSVLVVSRARRTARATSFGFVREQAVIRTKRFIFAAILFIALAGASVSLWTVSVRHPELLPTPAPTATATLIPSPTPRPPTATFTATLTPTVTPTPSVTPTPPEPSPPLALQTPLPAQAVTPGPNAALADVVLASGVRDNRPVDPSTRFAQDNRYVYAFLTFTGMSRDVPWTHAWYSEVDGQMVEIWSKVELWAYDFTRGYTWRYFEPKSPGRYELRVYIGRHLAQVVPFSVERE